MPKQNQNNSILPFQGGLNTEANRFNYPPECTLDEQNFILTKDGKRERRLGIVLSDEDINLAPEGITFSDKIRIYDLDEDGEISDVTPVNEEDTYVEIVDYNKEATFNGYVEHTLDLSNGKKYFLRVYQNGLFAEAYLVTTRGTVKKFKTYNKGEVITIPYSVTKYSSNMQKNPGVNFTMTGASNTNANIEAWLKKFIWSESKPNKVFNTSYITVTANKKGIYGDNTFNISSSKLISKPTNIVYNIKGGTTNNAIDSSNLTVALTSITVKSGGFGGFSRRQTKEVNLTYKGVILDKYNYVELKDSFDNVFKVSKYSKKTVTDKVTIVTGTGKGTVTKVRETTMPSYADIEGASQNPNGYIEVLEANYREYNNKTRAQLGRINSIQDRTVPKHFVWRNVAGIQGEEFSVFYTDTRLTICRHSPPYLLSNIVFDTIEYGASDVSCVDGKLVIVNRNTDKVRCILYDIEEEDFVEKDYVLMTRDLWGISETNIGGNVTTKSITVSSYSKYGNTNNISLKVNHKWNIPVSEAPTRISVVATGGTRIETYSLEFIDANNLNINFHHNSGGKIKSTSTFKVIGQFPQNAGVTLDPKLRCAPNEVRAYNLYNRGWGDLRKNSSGAKASPLSTFYNEYAKYPSHDESVYTALQLNPGYFDGSNWQKAWERMYPELWDDAKDDESSVQAAPGKAIIPVLKRGKGRWNWYSDCIDTTLNPGITSLPNDYTEGGPSCCCDYAGHLFYGGFSNKNHNSDDCSPFLGSYVFFTRLVRHFEDLNKCYQEGDPSSRVEADIVDTDGGFVRVSGAENIVKMVQCSKGMLIFAQNGVWLLMGGSDYGFTATNHKIQKISSYGVTHVDSICGDGDGWCYFSDEGIMQLYTDQFGDFQVNNISFNTIHSLFHTYDFPYFGVIGSYDPVSKEHHWMVECNSVYSTELILNLNYKCFTQNVFYNTDNQTVMIPLSFEESFETGINSTSDYRNFISTAYLCKDYGEYRVGYCGNIHFLDFTANDAKAYMMSGPNNLGDVGVYKQTPWLNMYLVNTEKGDTENNPINKSSCMVRVSWDWTMASDLMTTNSSDEYELEMNQNIHRWSPSFETYRHRQPKMLTSSSMLPYYGDVVESRSKLRGRGKVFSLICETNTGKDCRIAGMNITVNGNPLK